MSTDQQLRTEIEVAPCEILFDGDHLVLRGELDLSNERALAAALETARRPDDSTVVEMSGVSFVDSSALRAFVAFHTSGNDLTVRNPSPQVVRLLELAALDGVFTIETVDPR